MYRSNPDIRIMLACAIHGQMHRHLCDCAPRPLRLEVGKCQKDAWVQLSTVVSEMQPLTSIMLAEQSHLSRNTWKSKRGATLLVLQCRSHSYHKRRWGNLASTACLLSAPRSDLLATTSLMLRTAEVIMFEELKQSWSYWTWRTSLERRHRDGEGTQWQRSRQKAKGKECRRATFLLPSPIPLELQLHR